MIVVICCVVLEARRLVVEGSQSARLLRPMRLRFLIKLSARSASSQREKQLELCQ